MEGAKTSANNARWVLSSVEKKGNSFAEASGTTTEARDERRAVLGRRATPIHGESGNLTLFAVCPIHFLRKP